LSGSSGENNWGANIGIETGKAIIAWVAARLPRIEPGRDKRAQPRNGGALSPAKRQAVALPGFRHAAYAIRQKNMVRLGKVFYME
jgi:hypothetical protein